MSTENKKIPLYNSPKNWKEPLQGDGENCYDCQCYVCGYAFFGDKRALVCKECNATNVERSRMADEYPSLLAENEKLRKELEQAISNQQEIAGKAWDMAIRWELDSDGGEYNTDYPGKETYLKSLIQPTS